MNKRDKARDKARQQKAKKLNDLFRDDPQYPRKKLKVKLPIAPSVNHMYYTSRSGKRSLTSQATKYIRDSQALIRASVEDQSWFIDNTDVWYYLDIIVYMPDRVIRDSHNMLKLILDVFQGIAYRNDYFVMPRIQRVELDKKNPRLELFLKPQTVNDRKKIWK